LDLRIFVIDYFISSYIGSIENAIADYGLLLLYCSINVHNKFGF